MGAMLCCLAIGIVGNFMMVGSELGQAFCCMVLVCFVEIWLGDSIVSDYDDSSNGSSRAGGGRGFQIVERAGICFVPIGCNSWLGRC